MKKVILDIAKYIGAIATIGGAALWFDAQFDRAKENQHAVLDSLAGINETIEYINLEQSWMSADIEDLHDTINNVYRAVEHNTRANNNLYWLFRNQENYTREQLDQILEELLEEQESDASVDSEAEPYRHNGEVEFIPLDTTN
jgi:hypothetical protein